jgi:hypothetical protein
MVDMHISFTPQNVHLLILKPHEYVTVSSKSNFEDVIKITMHFKMRR